MKSVQYERVSALIIFGDMTGFTRWARRAGPDEFGPLITCVYNEILKFREESQFPVKLVGDGFVAVKEIPEKDSAHLMEPIIGLAYNLTKRIRRHIYKHPYPRPDGFRIRVTVGKTWRIKMGYSGVEFLGYQMNYCSRLLSVEKSLPFVCSESVRDAFSHKKTHLKFKMLKTGQLSMEGVDNEDLQKLFSFGFGPTEKKKSTPH